MNQSHISLLDLPYEILVIILKKLDNIDALYSLLGIDNHRLNMIVRGNMFTKNINFVLPTSTDNVLPIADSVLDRFCFNILPKIHHNVKSFTLESGSMERILLAADFPNLTELKLFNFNQRLISHHFTGKTLTIV